jgi:hypothetical protein
MHARQNTGASIIIGHARQGTQVYMQGMQVATMQKQGRGEGQRMREVRKKSMAVQIEPNFGF